MIGRRSQLDRDCPVAGLCEPGALVSTPARRILRPRGFTLIELLITVSIIAIMASMVLMALYGAGEAAKTAKTRAMIAKIDAIIKARWESYQTRRVPVKTPPDEWNDLNGDGICQVGDFIDLNQNGVPNTGEPGFNDLNLDGMAQTGEYVDHNSNGTPDPGEAIDNNGNGTPDPGEYNDFNGNNVPNVYPNRGYIRLYALRDLMRMELPDRWTDVTDDPQTWSGYPIARPAVSQAYLRKYLSITPPPSQNNQSAECLYLIVMAAVPDDADSRDVFKGADIGDIDNDGAPELLDAWGIPIKFLRWAPGFQFSELQTAVSLTSANGMGTVTVNGKGLSPSRGSYTGGTLIEFAPAVTGGDGQPKVFNTTKMARIDQYAYVGPQATINTSSTASFSLDAVITNPDPFDPSRAHATPATPNFALYPLVFSSGPNKCSGIMTGQLGFRVAEGGASGNKLNPLSTHVTAYTPPLANPVMLGCAVNDDTERNYVPNGWQDNIHNHLIGLK